MINMRECGSILSIPYAWGIPENPVLIIGEPRPHTMVKSRIYLLVHTQGPAQVVKPVPAAARARLDRNDFSRTGLLSPVFDFYCIMGLASFSVARFSLHAKSKIISTKFLSL
jgi:hypothetical protein